MEVSGIRLNIRVETDEISKTTADLNTLELLHLEIFPVPTVLRLFKIQTTQGTTMATEVDVRTHHTKSELLLTILKPQWL
jgi:hypothetical protein